MARSLLQRRPDAKPAPAPLARRRAGDTLCTALRGPPGTRRLTPSAAFAAATQAHAAGDGRRAETLYKETLRQAPDHADAWHCLGRLVYEHGNHLDALECVEKSIRLRPRVAEFQATFGLILRAMGKAEAALEATRRALRISGDSAHVLVAHGLALSANGQRAEAVKILRRAVARDPANVDAHMWLGTELALSGQPGAAVAPFRATRKLAPARAEPAYNLACALRDCGEAESALAEFRAALALRPGYFEAKVNLALMLMDQAPDEAEALLRDAAALQPRSARPWINLGRLLTQENRFTEALRAYETARARESGPEADIAVADALRNCAAGDDSALPAAAALAEAVLAAHPAHDGAHMSLAFTRLLRGALDSAWPHFTHRQERAQGLRPFGPAPRIWRGEALDGTLLIYDEQGAGDLIQMLRFVPLAVARARRVVLFAPPPLCPLLRRLPGIAGVHAFGEGGVPEHDAICADMDLPGIFGASLATLPAATPYLTPDPEMRERWQARLAALPGLRVGLAWAGNPAYGADRHRSLDPALLLPLADLPGLSLVSLQPGAPPPAALGLWDETARLTDYGETAALISALDLVISVDTGVAHLAGALGKTVWLLNRYAPDWRWLLHRADSPWYPTLRQFRQRAPGDWPGVIADIRAALAGLAAAAAARGADGAPVAPPHGAPLQGAPL